MGSSMSKGLNPKRQLLILIAVAAIGFAALLFFEKTIITDTWNTLKGAKLRYVLLLPVFQVLNYYFIGMYYRQMFAQFGAKITATRAWGVVAAMNFVNQVLPSGGLSGITYLAYGFRMKLETGKTTLVQIGRYMFAFASYAVLAPLAIFLVTQSGRSDELDTLIQTAQGNWVALAVSISFLLLVGMVIASFFNKWVAHAFGRQMLRVLNFFNKRIFRRSKRIELNIVKQLNREFHQGAELIKERGLRSIVPGVNMLISACLEVFIVYISVLAVGGGEVGIGPVFLAFVVANIVGTISIIPGDVGVHEAAVVLVLVAFGLDNSVAISATLLYRVFNKLIFLPIGFYFYAHILKPALEANSKAKQLKSAKTA
jgi:uncharacterized protein (TIRG00374 family)